MINEKATVLEEREENLLIQSGSESPVPGLFTLAPLSTSFSGAALDALSMARTIGKKDPVNTNLLRIKDVEITHAEISKLGVGEQKLLRYGVSMFTKENARNEQSPKLRVYGSTQDFARACIIDPSKGIDPRKMSTPEEQAKENRRAAKALDNFKSKLRKNADNLQSARFRWTESTKGKNKTYSGMSFISAYRINDDVISLEFSQSAAEYLVQRTTLSETPRALYAISDTNPNAYAIGEAMAKHYTIDNNVIADTERVLKVETLLSYTDLGNAKGATGRYRSRWVDRIKEPFEKALDTLTQSDFFKMDNERRGWEYCKAGQIPLSDEEAQSISSYEQWLSLYVRFELADFASHTERYKKVYEKKEAKRAEAEKKKARSRSKKTENEA